MSFGKYELLDSIGKGSIAEVFKAKSFGAQGFEKTLAIKRVFEEHSRNLPFTEAFAEDTQNALLLNHGNIVQVFDLGKVEDAYFLAMELVKGLSLNEIIRACQQSGQLIPCEIAVFIGAEIAKALDFAHRKRGRDLKSLNIVHGDLTPYNVLISHEGEVKVSDFGISRAKGLVLDALSEEIKSRLPYQAPEQLNGKGADRRSDVFSLGMLLVEMVTLTHPLQGITGASLESVLELGRHLELLGNREGVSADLLEIVGYMLKENPGERYEDAGTVYEGLIAYNYNTGARVGAHSLSELLNTLPAVSDIPIIEEQPVSKESLTEAFKFSIPPVLTEERADSLPDSLAPPVSGPETEIRDVSILAVDFHDANPKEALVGQLTEVIENNGGGLVSAEGSSMVAVFGLDLAYGRELEEAMDAAFKLRRAMSVLNPTKQSRLGVSVWPVKISVDRTAGVVENEVYLEALSKARGAAGCSEDSVLTSRRGRKYSSNLYQFEIFPVELPGGGEENLYKAIGRLPAPETFGRLFGRQEDLRALGKIFTHVASGKGGVLTLFGEAGVGKTRLLREGQWRLMSSGGDVAWFEAVCLPWNSLTSFSAVGAIFRALLALEELESRADMEEKIGRLRELGLTPEEVEAVSALMGITNGEGLNGDQGKLYFSALLHAVIGLSADRMVVLIWEHAEHLDLESKRVLEKMAQATKELSLLIIFSSRSEPDEGIARGATFRQHLLPLAAKDAERLFLSRIGASGAPKALLSYIYDTTLGNPLHIEELVKKLVDQSRITLAQGEARIDDALVSKLEKESLEQVVEYRIGCLSSEKLRILRTASVLGHSFNTKLLGAVLRQNVTSFKQTLLSLSEDNFLTRLLAGEFAFSVGYFRDVIYAEIPSKERSRLHRALVNAIDTVYEGQTDRFTGRIGIHFQETGNFEKAISRFIEAGERAEKQQAGLVALALYIRALELLQELPERDPNRILSVCYPIGRMAIETSEYTLGLDKIQVAEWIADDVTDRSTLAKTLLLIAELNAHLEHNVEVDWYIEWAVDLVRELDDPELGNQIRTSAGRVYYHLGDLKRSIPFYREAIDLIRETSDKDRLVSCMAQLSNVEASAGEIEQAMQTLAEADELIDDTLNPATRCKVEYSRGSAYASAGNTLKAIDAQMRALEIAKEYNLKEHIASTAHTAGELYLELGDHAKAFSHLMTSKEVAEELGLGSLVNTNKLLLDYIDVVELGTDEGVQSLEKSLLDALERESAWEQLHLLFYLSKIYIERGQNVLAKEHLTQLVDLGSKLQNRLYHTKAEHMLKEIAALANISV